MRADGLRKSVDKGNIISGMKAGPEKLRERVNRRHITSISCAVSPGDWDGNGGWTQRVGVPDNRYARKQAGAMDN